MWRDLSVTAVQSPSSINMYQYPQNGQYMNGGGGGGGGGGPNGGNGGGINKWNQPGNRASYSLPHPAHTQSNQRWQHLDSRPLIHSPSFQHIPNNSSLHSISSNYNNNINMKAQRPVSMYDMSTSSQPHSFSSFMPLKKNGSMSKIGPPPPSIPPQPQQQQHHQTSSNGLRQRPGELVRTCSTLFYRANGKLFLFWFPRLTSPPYFTLLESN